VLNEYYDRIEMIRVTTPGALWCGAHGLTDLDEVTCGWYSGQEQLAFVV